MYILGDMQQRYDSFMNFIPFLNLYPTWAQIVIFICVIIVVFILIFVPRKTLPSKKFQVSVEHSVKKKFDVNISLTEFHTTTLSTMPTATVCYATLNIMNVGDFPFTIHDLYITVSLSKDGAKSVHKAFNENVDKFDPIVISAGSSKVVRAYFDVRKAIYAVPDKLGQRFDLYSDIVVEAIAQDGLREKLIFRSNSLVTEVVQINENYIHKLLHSAASHRTNAIRYLGNHATK